MIRCFTCGFVGIFGHNDKVLARNNIIHTVDSLVSVDLIRRDWSIACRK